MLTDLLLECAVWLTCHKLVQVYLKLPAMKVFLGEYALRCVLEVLLECAFGCETLLRMIIRLSSLSLTMQAMTWAWQRAPNQHKQDFLHQRSL